MLKKYIRLNILFAFLLIVQLITASFHIAHLAVFVKPCLTLSLLIFFYLRTRLKGRFHKRVFAGLIFALAGELLLMYSATDLMPAIVTFLLCHIFYTSAFYLDFKSAPELDKKGARVAILCCAVLSIGFYFYLRPHLGMMKIPVMAYILVISMMMMMACFRNQRVNTSSFRLILFGAMFFLLSDVIFACNEFIQQVDHAFIWTTATYMIAQYLITIGAAERKLIHNS